MDRIKAFIVRWLRRLLDYLDPPYDQTTQFKTRYLGEPSHTRGAAHFIHPPRGRV